MTVARTSMRFHPKGLPPPNPNGIQVGDVHHQGPSHPKVRVKRRNVFSGRGGDVSGATSAISRTTALLGSQGKLPLQDQLLVGRKGYVFFRGFFFRFPGEFFSEIYSQATQGTGKQASQPASKQASQRASKQASQQASKQGSKKASQPASKQARQQASKAASQQASKPASKQASQPASKQASQPASKQASQ